MCNLLHNTSSVEISRKRVGMPRVCTLVLFIVLVLLLASVLTGPFGGQLVGGFFFLSSGPVHVHCTLCSERTI